MRDHKHRRNNYHYNHSLQTASNLLIYFLPYLVILSNLNFRFVAASYGCPTITPSTGLLYAGVTATVTLDSRCSFTDNYLGTTMFASSLDSMASAAQKTIGKVARINMDRASFMNGAVAYVLGYTTEVIPAAYATVGFQVSITRCLFLHDPSNEFVSPLTIQGLFPPKTNITISGNHFEVEVLSPVSIADLLVSAMIKLNLKTFSQASLLVIERNNMFYNFMVDEEITFDSDDFEKLVEERHKSPSSAIQPIATTRILGFVYVMDLILYDSASIRISNNYFSSEGSLSIVDAEDYEFVHTAICFELLFVVSGSNISCYQNTKYDVLDIKFLGVHGSGNVQITFWNILYAVQVADQSSITISQNAATIDTNVSTIRSTMVDHSITAQCNAIILFAYMSPDCFLDEESFMVIALNYFLGRPNIDIVVDETNSVAALWTAFLHHDTLLSVWENSHYLIHGNIVRTITQWDLDKDMVVQSYFASVHSLSIAGSSRVQIGCANKFRHPELFVYREEDFFPSQYSDIYEQFNPKRAKEWNGPLMNRSSFDYIQTHTGNESDTLTNRNLLGSGSNINYKCYTNYAAMTMIYHEVQSTVTFAFISMSSRFLVVLNGSYLGVVNNLIFAASESSFSDIPLRLITMEILPNPQLHNIPYNGQMVIASNCANSVVSSRINIDEEFTPDGTTYVTRTREEQLAFSQYDKDSAVDISSNILQAKWKETIGNVQCLINSSAMFAIWISDGSIFQVSKNKVVLIANSIIHKVPAGQTSVSPYLDPASPSYDPYFDWKSASGGAFAFLTMTSDIANPNGTINVILNELFFLKDDTVIPFSGYPNASSGQFDKSYWDMSQAEVQALQASTPMIDGKPVTFVMRSGPPLIRPFEWSTNYFVDVWQGGPVKRYPNPQSMIALLKNEIPLVMTPNTSLMPWTNDLRINYCGNRVNLVEVESAEVMPIYKTLVNFRGLSLNKDLGTEATDGVGLEIHDCPVPPTQTMSLSGTSTVSTTTSYRPTSSISVRLSPSATLVNTKSDTQSQTVTPFYLFESPQSEDDSLSKKILDATSSAIGALVPTIGTSLGGSTLNQIAISNAIMRMVKCVKSDESNGREANDGEDDLPIMVHPFRFSIDKPYPLHQERGAIVGNAIVAIVAVAFVRFVAVFVAGKFINANEDSRLIVGWPSAFTLPFVALVEGTTTCATRLLNDLSVDDEDVDDCIGMSEGNSSSNSTNSDSLAASPTTSTNNSAANTNKEQSSVPSYIKAVDYFLGFGAFLAFGAVSILWAYYVTLAMPKRYMKHTKKNRELWSEWLMEPRYEWEYLPASNKHKLEDTLNPSNTPIKEDSFTESLLKQQTLAVVNEVSSSTINELEMSVLSEAEVTAILQRYTHFFGDKYFLCIDLLCFVSAMAVGISEGLADTKCRSKITVASVAALAQVFFNLSSTVPLDLIVQSLLGLCTATLTAIALVRVYSKVAVNLPLEEGMEYVGTIGNVLGLIAIAIPLAVITFRMFKARRIARAVELRNLREHFASSASRKYDASHVSQLKKARNGGLSDELDDLQLSDYDEEYRHKSKKRVKSTANQVFEVKFDLGEDLDLFLLDVEEAAMNTVEKRNKADGAEVDELDIEMSVVGVGEDLSLTQAH